MDIRSKKTGVFMGTMVNAGDEVRHFFGTLFDYERCSLSYSQLHGACLMIFNARDIQSFLILFFANCR